VHAHKVARVCLGIDSGVRDFRRGPGTVNIVVGYRLNVELVGFVTYPGTLGQKNGIFNI